MKIDELQKQVGEWARANFDTKHAHHPLLGVVEELGEFFSSARPEDRRDALGDIMIYLADYCERNGLSMVPTDFIGMLELPMVAVGRLAHFHLKGEQGIRYTPEEAKRLQQEAVWSILRWVDAYCFREEKRPAMEIASEVWLNVVSKRDWKKNPQDGKA